MASEETPAQQAAFAQRKLEKHYTSIYKALIEYRHSIEAVQHVLVWRRRGLSLALYAFVHWIFILQVRSSDGPVSQFGNLLFWLVIADVFYRAATKQSAEESGNGGGEGATAASENSGRSRGWSLRRREQPQSPAMVTFEDAIMKRYTPREPGVLPPFEVICLWLADVVMFLDNTFVVLKHWSIQEPLTFCTALGLPGLVLIFLGRYIPTLVLLYVLVMFLLTWPYIEHHNLRLNFFVLAQAYYPGILKKVKDIFKFLKKMALSRNKEESPEFSLSEGDEARTEQALQEAFDQATGQKNQRQDEPGMSLLQDPVLGLHTNDFQNSDMDSLIAGSLAPGPGEFPSINNLDQSLCLPSFPPQGHGAGHETMPSIGEELEDEDTSLALSSQGSVDLDPLMDSIEVEFGLHFPDSGRRSNITEQTRSRQVRPGQRSSLATNSNRAGISSQPLGRTGLTQAVTTTSSSQLHGTGYSQGYSPPPTYQSAFDGSDGGIIAAGGRDGYEWPIEDPPAPLGGRSGGGTGPKSSSTPLIREGMRRRGGQRQQQQEQAPQLDENALFGRNSELLQELDTL